MSSQELPEQAAHYISSLINNQQAKIAIVLGSGLGGFAECIEHKIQIPYDEIPGFSPSQVKGHPGKFLVGKIKNTSVYCLQGRNHWYEGLGPEPFKVPIRTLKCLGVEILILTNAAASLNSEVKPGQLMLISDHINFQFYNPLVGNNDDAYGPRFFDMKNAYDLELRQQITAKAKAAGISLTEGVYLGVLGPNYETPAEIRAFRILGADAVGMSTVPETLIARHCGLRVMGISNITNLGVGMSEETLTHEAVLEMGAQTVKRLSQLLTTFLEGFHD